MEPIKLTEYTRFSGCGAKLGPGLLDKALCGLSQPSYPELIADFRNSEDAGVYRLDGETALVQTLDFFPPIVDDPYTFGQIAAANALSDIYAMGGRPVTALSIVCFPVEKLDLSYLREIMRGGMDQLILARTALVGGHSLEDQELKFGLSVTGLIRPDRVLRNNTPRPGEAVILTKPLGTGTINTALRAGMASPESLEAATKSMVTLNKAAAEILADYPVSACTDVTGFGLAGHACEMISGSSAGLRLDMKGLRRFPGTEEYLAMGLIPAGTYRNREFRIGFIRNAGELSPLTLDLIFDPQTSGGLLFTLEPLYVPEILDRLRQAGLEPSLAGEITDAGETIEVVE